MTSYQYHMEALRKQRVLERKQEALRRQAMANEDAQKIGNSLQYRTQMNDGNMSLEPDNRYSYNNTNKEAPTRIKNVVHTDQLFHSMFPGRQNYSSACHHE